MSEKEHRDFAEELLRQDKQRQARKAKPVTHGEYDSDLGEILSQIRNLQKRVDAIEKREVA